MEELWVRKVVEVGDHDVALIVKEMSKIGHDGSPSLVQCSRVIRPRNC